jgi:hypothetical protein
VRDSLGRENTRLSEIAALQIPGVNLQYGGDEPWMNIVTGSDRTLIIGDEVGADPLEVEVVEFNNIGVPVSMHRYRFEPGNKPWRLEIHPDLAPDLKVDQNDDENFAPEETVAATHSSSGEDVDLTTPTITMNLSVNNGQIVANFSASDGSQPAPTIRYSLDGGSLETYSGALNFAANSSRRLKIYAEDASGNISGLIETTINPELSIGMNTSGSIVLAWPLSDGYVLEESDSLAQDSWIKSPVTIKRAGQQNGVLLGLERPSVKFYRLRSSPFER